MSVSLSAGSWLPAATLRMRWPGHLPSAETGPGTWGCHTWGGPAQHQASLGLPGLEQ